MRDTSEQPEGVGSVEDCPDGWPAVVREALKDYLGGKPESLAAMLGDDGESRDKLLSAAPGKRGPKPNIQAQMEWMLVLEVIREITHPDTAHYLWQGEANGESLRQIAQAVVAERYHRTLSKGHTTRKGARGEPMTEPQRTLDRIVTKFVKQGLGLPTARLGFSQWKDDGAKRWRLFHGAN